MTMQTIVTAISTADQMTNGTVSSVSTKLLLTTFSYRSAQPGQLTSDVWAIKTANFHLPHNPRNPSAVGIS